MADLSILKLFQGGIIFKIYSAKELKCDQMRTRASSLAAYWWWGESSSQYQNGQ